MYPVGLETPSSENHKMLVDDTHFPAHESVVSLKGVLLELAGLLVRPGTKKTQIQCE
jgi:hypothetical protein